MTLKYAGPKPMISKHGISFKDGKEDKYVYLNIVYQILKTIDQDSSSQNSFESNSNNDAFDSKQMYQTILSYDPTLKEVMKTHLNNYLVHLDNEIEDVKKSPAFEAIEKDTFVNNLKIMKEYKIQRATNKIFYMHTIGVAVDVIKNKKIKKISTPFNEKFWHTLKTIQGHLARNKRGLRSDLKVITNDDIMYAVLTIDNN